MSQVFICKLLLPFSIILFFTLTISAKSFGQISDTANCSTPLTPYLQINCDGWQLSSSTYVKQYQSITLKPESTTEGSWSWSGPNGFNASTREITLTYFDTAQSGDYVVTYISESGCTSYLTFTLTICIPAEITPYLRIDDGTWEESSSATVNSGQTIMFRPQSASGGVWSWDGPGGYSASTNEITISNISNSQFGDYFATYTSISTCKSYITFTISNKGSTSCKLPVPFGYRKAYTIETTHDGLSLNLLKFDKKTIVTIYDIKGSSVYKNVCLKNKLLISGLPRNVYILKIRQGQKESIEKFTVDR